ncbi:MAG: adenine phosphoribosyltransferase [Acidimicrobiales bacterium]
MSESGSVLGPRPHQGDAWSVASLQALIRDVPDFPSPGILFKDITPLLANGSAWQATVSLLAELHAGLSVDRVVGIEARGFVLGAAVAYHLGVGFVPVRKPGKLPHRAASVSYDLEYGQDSLEMHLDAVERGQRILVVDDVLATGGTAAAALQLVHDVGAEVVGVTFLIELAFLGGRARLGGVDARSLITY